MNLQHSAVELFASVCFILAIIHTFMVSYFQKLAHRFTDDSFRGGVLHCLGEVETVFGFWAAIFLMTYGLYKGGMIYNSKHELVDGAIYYFDHLNFSEPIFVFVIMAIASSRPLIRFAEKVIIFASKVLPFSKTMSFYLSALIIGPVLGSFITEPAAMTVTSLILLDNFYQKDMSESFKYATIALLFVNVSIGGTLTHFAAPPVLMVASKWDWGMWHMFSNFGYKSLIAIVISSGLMAYLFKKELKADIPIVPTDDGQLAPKKRIIIVHLFFLALVVLFAHHPSMVVALFIFFLAFTNVTKKFQSPLKLREALLVAFFLAGLITLGSMQSWWLKPILAMMSDSVLYLSAIGLTAITDNAALTYLGSLADLSEAAKYFLVAGAVTGGGLTVIANAPNPVGYGLLKGTFRNCYISPLKLVIWALLPTSVAILAFLLLPSL